MTRSLALLLALVCCAPTALEAARVMPGTPPASALAASIAPRQVQTIQHADALAELDRKVSAVLARSDSRPAGWLAHEQAANLYLTRARLSGDHDDYARAEAEIDRAFAIAGDGVGPFFTRVALNFTLHRLDRVAADLDRIERFAVLTDADRNELVIQRADLAFQSGDYPAAVIGFEQALAVHADITNQARLALYRWKTGESLRAEQLYHDALASLPPGAGEPAAWLHLQLGLIDLEHGRWDDALAHYNDGAAEFAGYWLLDEHIAEILTLEGKTDAALAAYSDILRRTASPEFMDAVAGIHLAAGRTAEARVFIDRAEQIYEARLARFPEAAYGHALGHFLDYGEDPTRVVDLAEQNHRTRPNAEAKILLARAYLKAKRVEDARAAITAALVTPWRTAELYAVAAAVATAAGDATTAGKHREQALAIDPYALDSRPRPALPSRP